MLRVMFCGTGWHDVVPIIARQFERAALDVEVTVRDRGRPLASQLSDVDVALPSNAPFAREEFAAAPRLRLVQQPAVGYEGIDLAEARRRGIPVCNAPATNTGAVAEAALFLLLALARRFPVAQRAFAGATIGSPVGIELSARTLGIVGLGRSGSHLASLATALGMRIESVSSRDSRKAIYEMLSRSDAVSIHCPLTAETRDLIDDQAFGAMRPGALLVNVARGAIVTRSALERALDSGRLGGAGLDVFWDEPWNPEDPLFRRDDVVTLPHVAGSTVEAFGRIAQIVASNVATLVRGGDLEHRVDGGA